MTVAHATMHDLDDGATEVVTRGPAHRGPEPLDLEQIARAAVRDRAAGMQGPNGTNARRHFLIMRRQGRSPIKLTLLHYGVFQHLWRLWSEKRVSGVDDPGVTIPELVEATQGHNAESVGRPLRSMVRNGIVRAVSQHVGWHGRRLRYYPTSEGLEAFALAQHLGDGAFVQVGRNNSAWKSRSNSEPGDVFQHASFLKRMLGVQSPAPVEIA